MRCMLCGKKIPTKEVPHPHHLETRLVVLLLTLHRQEVLDIWSLVQRLVGTLNMMNMVPPLNIQKKDIRLKRRTWETRYRQGQRTLEQDTGHRTHWSKIGTGDVKTDPNRCVIT